MLRHSSLLLKINLYSRNKIPFCSRIVEAIPKSITIKTQDIICIVKILNLKEHIQSGIIRRILTGNSRRWRENSFLSKKILA